MDGDDELIIPSGFSDRVRRMMARRRYQERLAKARLEREAAKAPILTCACHRAGCRNRVRLDLERPVYCSAQCRAIDLRNSN